MSLSLRLNLLLAGILAIAITAILGAMALEAGPRSEAELRAITALSRQYVERSLLVIQNAAHPATEFQLLLEEFASLRHVDVVWEPDDGDGIAQMPSRKAATRTQSWMERLATPTVQPTRVKVALVSGIKGDLVISASPHDEAGEILDTLWSVATKAVALSIAILALSSLLIVHSLAPITAIGTGLRRLGEGDYEVRMAPGGTPELAAICHEVNVLAGVLARTDADNRQLARDLVRARDDERRELARELHDELGPHLFGARASGSALIGIAEGGAPGIERARQLGRAVLDQIEQIQAVNRRVLTRLVPPGLAELGLVAALRGLLEQWGGLREDLVIDLEMVPEADRLGGAEALTVYRIIQESITNAVRHGNVGRLAIRIVEELELQRGGRQLRAIAVSVADDGDGVADGAAEGIGLRGMRERVRALGGTFELGPGPAGGTVVTARLPWPLEADKS